MIMLGAAVAFGFAGFLLCVFLLGFVNAMAFPAISMIVFSTDIGLAWTVAEVLLIGMLGMPVLQVLTGILGLVVESVKPPTQAQMELAAALALP